MNRVIEIIVSASGETRAETKGFTGADCLETSRFVENALGKRVDEKLTLEFHASPGIGEQTRLEN